MALPQTNHELLQELDVYINELPNPMNALFMLEIYKMFINHKIDTVAGSLINQFAATQTDTQ